MTTPWTQEEDEKLDLLVRQYWWDFSRIAEQFRNRSREQCSARWTQLSKNEESRPTSIPRFRGTEKAETAGNSLGKVEEETGEIKNKGETPGTQSATKASSLNVKLSNDWKLREDEVIVRFLRNHGAHWAKLVHHLPNRRQQDVRNRWHSSCRWLHRNFKIDSEYLLAGGRLRSDVPDIFYLALLQKGFSSYKKYFRNNMVAENCDKTLEWLVSLSAKLDLNENEFGSSNEKVQTQSNDEKLSEISMQKSENNELVDTPAKNGAVVLLMFRELESKENSDPAKNPSPVSHDPAYKCGTNSLPIHSHAQYLKQNSALKNLLPSAHRPYSSYHHLYSQHAYATSGIPLGLSQAMNGQTNIRFH